MRILILFSILFGFNILVNAQIKTPSASPSATVSQSIGLGKVTIEYARPSLKGRKMIGTEIVPYGKVWRTGANKIPNLILSQDMVINGQTVPAGTYGLATIPDQKSWIIIITKKADQWGVYEYSEADDFMRFTVPVEKVKEKQEHFTMGFSNFTPISVNLYITWENTLVKFAISQNPDASIMAEIAAKTSAPEVTTDTYMSAANYYFENDKDLNQALKWADKVLEKSKEYWTYALRAKIAQKLGKCEIAKADAQSGLILAKKENDASYIARLSKIIQECK